MRTLTAEDRLMTRKLYISKNSQPITEENGLGVVYVGPSSAHGRLGWYSVTGFIGTAAKPAFHYIYRTDAQVDAKIADFFNNLREHKARVSARRSENLKPHNFIVGDIVTNSWGYDQTNVDFYRVVKTTNHFVWLQPVAATSEDATGPMSDTASLALDENCQPIAGKGEITKHAATGSYVTMRHGCGSKWDGRPLHRSWYA